MARKSGVDGIRVTFEPGEREIFHQAGMTLLETAQRHDVRIASACGGRGICKTCIVHLTDGRIPPASDADKHFFSEAKIGKGWRRACQIEPQASCTVHVPARARADSARMHIDAADFWIPPEPVVRTVQISLSPPTLDDKVADADRLIATINREPGDSCTKVDMNVLRSLSETLRRHDWKVQAVVRLDEVVAVQASNTKLLGLAVASF
jgi:uncharacterized 2Fe-2S/4Fe-4S cluster protein (DUF4445 family)